MLKKIISVVCYQSVMVAIFTAVLVSILFVTGQFKA
jgi:hypothetical protein